MRDLKQIAIAITLALNAFPSAGWADPVHSYPNLSICGSAKRITCVVDGDTLWIRGEKFRLANINTAETNGRCRHERELAARATQMIRAILASEPFVVTRTGRDHYGRTLATIRNGRGDVGHMLVAKGLAHEWRGRKESWC